jgi:fatty acid desaturase
MDAGSLARAEQDARWLANEPRRQARKAKADRFALWLLFIIPGFCFLAWVIGNIAAAIGLVPFLLLILIMQNATRI